ncbi:hypothetical protein DFH29DRAFT_881512 [Suillus ampliporus]|nr:hypothetical protein DFH29DRAFT_881512 [Suillus ampliporus]
MVKKQEDAKSNTTCGVDGDNVKKKMDDLKAITINSRKIDLHICGPAWVHWTFYVKQYCLHLKTGLHSKWHTWSGLSHVVLYTAYLSQLSSKFDLQDELKDLNPCCGQQELENEQSFKNLHLPFVMPLWGKMRIISGGDLIRTKYALRGVSNAKGLRPVNAIGYGRLDKILVFVGRVQTQGETFIIDQWLAPGGNDEIGDSLDTSDTSDSD